VTCGYLGLSHEQFSSSRRSLGARESFTVNCDKPHRLSASAVRM
jgi:hypothetical protein